MHKYPNIAFHLTHCDTLRQDCAVGLCRSGFQPRCAPSPILNLTWYEGVFTTLQCSVINDGLSRSWPDTRTYRAVGGVLHGRGFFSDHTEVIPVSISDNLFHVGVISIHELVYVIAGKLIAGLLSEPRQPMFLKKV